MEDKESKKNKVLASPVIKNMRRMINTKATASVTVAHMRLDALSVETAEMIVWAERATEKDETVQPTLVEAMNAAREVESKIDALETRYG